ncbi:unnamed protein product [Dimorphilus gyrociliatus]|uniref:Large ribosomal subunit protein P2 n=1 Tax=Dimorphilus gyrociliatus TaxID=2664684 RepID=A0A7I8W0K5_9ANNE|nr:unnamed protein product [Dimorphilus gyrociliatus]
MRYVAAYLLAKLANRSDINLDDLKTIIGSVGVDVDEKQAKIVLKSLQGKSVEELLTEGSSRLASMPCGGAPAAAAAVGDDSAAAVGAEKKEEAKKKEESDESDDDMGFGLFD